MIFISKNAFWNFFDFIVLCSLIILAVFFIRLRNQVIEIRFEIIDIKFQMKALHQDMFQMEHQLLQKQYILKKNMAKIKKDNRPEIHVHGNGEGSVKLYNVSGEIVVETIEGLEVVKEKTRYEK